MWPDITEVGRVTAASGDVGEACQRWRGGHVRWRRRDRGAIEPNRYQVVAIGAAAARLFVLEHHYSHSLPAARLQYGLVDRPADQLVGVAVLSVPVQASVLTGVFPGLKPYVESLELGRFCLLDEVPANGETYFLARASRLAAREGVRGVVSFSDPLPRHTAAGEVVLPGHWGTIYQAGGAAYLGRGTARTITVLPDATVLNSRSASKVRVQERGHRHVENRLVRLGAPAPAGEPATWLRSALEAVGAVSVRHRGCHRYAFRPGLAARRRAAVSIALAARPFPKSIDPLPRPRALTSTLRQTRDHEWL